MRCLNTDGFYKINAEELKIIQRQFFGAWIDEVETKEAINRVYNDNGYLMDTHTAVAWRALDKYRFLTSDETYTVVLSTANPYKFANSVLSALEDKPVSAEDPFVLLDRLHEMTGVEIPAPMAALKDQPVLHKEVIPADKMEMAVLTNLI